MKRIFSFILVFIAGFILGEMDIKSITSIVIKGISQLDFASFPDIFSSREIAIGIWIIIFTIFILSKPKIRDSVFNVVRTATSKQIIIPLVIIIIYSTILIVIASLFSFWELNYLKDVTFWVIFVGVPVSFGVITINENNHYFTNILKRNFKFIVIVEFLLSTITFSILTELILLPLLTFLILLETVATTKDEYYKVKKLLSFITAFVGFGILGLTLKKAIENYVTFNSLDLLIKFTIPIALSFLFIPIAYCFATFSEYQQLFISMSFKEPKDKIIKRKHRWEIIKACKLSYRKVTHFKKIYLKNIYVNMSNDEFNQLIENFQKKM
ncbi:hypothetical protein [Tenuibacillus multivorans]|uniref:Uncharacterized protein n=1 Tax=Tenuibacillus multivorans TaxID=237069 RepID=A0A1G9YK30_9BACI|nr:hypothetical protein [Tenuibacillus multivorans]GEL78699.1 hypothetical protein TMU01_29340 [Tenuibacillus multivorans]SDN08835.1 hypothetical protein SAMN05216498_1419 [Tenuibacillus multivorans]